MKVGPNEPCPCGSEKKYKKCCWLKDRDAEAARAVEESRNASAAAAAPSADPTAPKPKSKPHPKGNAVPGRSGAPRRRAI
jgi:hypothetical protein